MPNAGLSKYKALFDSNMLGVASTDFDDTIVDANDAFLSIIGYTYEDLQNGQLRWSKISPSKYDAADEEKMRELFLHKTIIPFEKEYIHKDGHSVPVLVGAEAFELDNLSGVCFAVDISELKTLEQKKDDFIGVVSHELKTPLSVMKLQSDLLIETIHNSDKSQQLQFAREISAQIDKIDVMITDLLNMARFRDQSRVFSIAAIPLAQCVAKVLSELAPINHGRKIDLQASKEVYVQGNAARLSQVIINLVNNALRYSEAHTSVSIEVSDDDKKAYIRIRDEGIGIDESDISRIFERYYRVDHADRYKESAAGIGLYICSEIIKHHNGEIAVESSKDKGTCFTIILPKIA